MLLLLTAHILSREAEDGWRQFEDLKKRLEKMHGIWEALVGIDGVVEFAKGQVKAMKDVQEEEPAWRLTAWLHALRTLKKKDAAKK